MFRFLVYLMMFISISYAKSEINENKLECIILEDENSIICKFEKERSFEDETVVFQWIDPFEKVSRQRSMIIPAGHGSIYDYRYIKGRLEGKWTVKVLAKDKQYETKFEIK